MGSDYVSTELVVLRQIATMRTHFATGRPAVVGVHASSDCQSRCFVWHNGCCSQVEEEVRSVLVVVHLVWMEERRDHRPFAKRGCISRVEHYRGTVAAAREYASRNQDRMMLEGVDVESERFHPVIHQEL